MGNLPSWAAQLISLVGPGSRFESALLFPIGILAKELAASHAGERELVRAQTEDAGATVQNEERLLCQQVFGQKLDDEGYRTRIRR